MTSALPAAILWDMDGTIIDSEPYWIETETELIKAWGGSWSKEQGLELVGSALEKTARVMQANGVQLPVDQIVDELTEAVRSRVEQNTPWRPGARELIEEIGRAGVPMALVTMSMGPLAGLVARSLGDDVFTVVVTGSDVENGKPHPEPYLSATAQLGVDPAECVAIEDSIPGIASAVAAGTRAIGVPMHVDLPESEDYVLWPTLAGRGLADLAAVATAPRSASRRAS